MILNKIFLSNGILIFLFLLYFYKSVTFKPNETDFNKNITFKPNETDLDKNITSNASECILSHCSFILQKNNNTCFSSYKNSIYKGFEQCNSFAYRI